jgi:hypothetical protein
VEAVTRRLIITLEGAMAPTKPARDETLVKVLARAWRWQRMLEEDRFASIQELAEAERVSLSYINRILRLTMVAPDIVERILDGRATVGLPQLMKPFPVAWDEQREQLASAVAKTCR